MHSKIIQIAEHNDPINCVQFVDNYARMASSSKSELILWSLDVDEDPDFEKEREKRLKRKRKDTENGEETETDYSRFIVQVK